MRMIGKTIKSCTLKDCRCANYHDSKGKALEKRLAKRQEKQRLRNELRKY